MSEDLAREPADADADRDDNQSSDSLLQRREVLTMGAAAAAAGLGSGAFSGTASAASERHGISFDRVVNAVDDLGMDASGSKPIDSALQSTMKDGNTLVEFPPGTYLIDGQLTEGELNSWGIRGLGENPTDVTFVTNPGEGKRIIKSGDGNGILIENVAFDYSQKRAGSLGLILKAQDNLRVQDVHFVGFNPNEEEGGVVNLSPQILSTDGTAVVDGLVRKGATDIRPHRHLSGPANPPGIMWLGKKHKGTLVVRNSHLENAGENGIYASAPSGSIQIENSVFKNNNQAALRMGGKGSYVKNSRFVVDTSESDNENGLINPHSIIWETDKRGETGGYIEGCEFDYRNAPKKTTAAIWADGSVGEFTVRDTRIRIDTPEIAAIKLDDPTSSRLGVPSDRPWGVTLEKVSVTGSSAGSLPAIDVTNRPGTTVKSCCLQLSADRDGIGIHDSKDCRIEETNIDVGGQATVFDGAKVATSNVTKEASCPLPNVSDESGGSGNGNGGAASGNSDGSQTEGSTESTETTSEADDTKQSTDADSAEKNSDSSSTEKASDSGDAQNASDESTETNTREIVVHGPPKEIGRVDYRIRFDGDAKALTAADDELADGVFEGAVWTGHTDSISLTGSVVAVDELTEGGTITVDGEEVDPDTLGTSAAESQLPNTITVDGRDTAGVTRYEISVSGDLERDAAASSGEDASSTDSTADDVSDGRVAGVVDEGVDVYRFSGDITASDVDGKAAVNFDDNDG